MKKGKFLLTCVLAGMLLFFFQPAFAIEITYISSTLWSGANDVQVVGDYAYCSFINGLVILDVSNAAASSLVSKLYLQTGAKAIFVQENYVYLTNKGAGLVIIDISDPASPDSFGSYYTLGYANDVFVKDGLAYIAQDTTGLQIIDVSDPANPVSVGGYDTPGHTQNVFVKDSLAYVADGDGGLQIIDISDPANPDLIGSYYPPTWVPSISPSDFTTVSNMLSTWVANIQVVGDYAYCLLVDALVILDVSDPTSPSLMSKLYLDPEDGEGIGLFVQDEYVYVAAGYGGLQIVDARDPANPTITGTYTYNFPNKALNVFVKDRLGLCS